MTTTQNAESSAWRVTARLEVFSSAPALIALSFALTWLAPLWLLLLAPLVLGVPHVIGDLRCLTSREPNARELRVLFAISAPLALMTLLRAATLAGWGTWPRSDIACGIAAVCAGVFAARVGVRARAMAIAGVALVGIVACLHSATALLVLAHAHNLVAFGVYFVWARRRSEARFAFVLYGLALGMLLFAPVSVDGDGVVGGMSFDRLAEQFAPGLPADWARRIVLAFAFTQAVHYAVWVWLAPRERVGIARFEFTRHGMWLAAAAVVAVPLFALADPAATRSVYLTLVAFHVWFELAVFASWWRGARA